MAARPLRRLALAVLAAGVASLLLAPAASARPVTLTGTVQVAHADRGAGGDAPTYLLRTSKGLVGVRPAAGVRWYPVTGDRVRVRGDRRGGTVVVRRVTRLFGPRRLAGGTAVTGTRTVAVILVNFSDRTQTPWTRAQLQDWFFDASDSVAAYYTQQSFGQLTITGDVYDWHTIAATSTACNQSDWLGWGNQARAAAHVPGTYDHYVYVFPNVPSCGWAGLAWLPGDEAWINGYPQLRVMGHELGHNLGVHHASSLTCTSGGARVALSATCAAPDEYGDPFSIMGDGYTQHFSAFHKSQLGWLQAGNEQDASASGSYTLTPISTAGAGVKLLRVRRSATEWIYCDLRAASAPFEGFAGTTATDGVTLRLAPGSYATRTQTRLVDTTPATSVFSDAALTAGHSFNDPVSGVTITVTAVASGTATVQVQLGAAPNTAPGTPPNVTASRSGGSVTIGWGAAADDIGVGFYRVYRNADLVGTTTATSFSDTPPPGGVATYSVSAVDATGAEGARSAPVAVTVPPAAVQGLAAVSRPGGAVALTWSGAPGAVRYRVLRDGATVLETATSATEDTGLVVGRAYAYAVVAVDALGQTGPASAATAVTIVDARPPGRPRALSARRVTRASARLAWAAATDDGGIAYYRIERAGRLVKRTATRKVVVAVPRRTVTLAVRAVDRAGHVGPPARVVLRGR